MGLHSQFIAYSSFGNSKFPGMSISLSQSDLWMKQAKLIDGRKVTTTDTGMAFNSFKQSSISYEEWLKFVEVLALNKGLKAADLKQKLRDCGVPEFRTQGREIGSGGGDEMIY